MVLRGLAFALMTVIVVVYAMPTAWAAICHPEWYQSGWERLSFLTIGVLGTVVVILWIAGLTPDPAESSIDRPYRRAEPAPSRAGCAADRSIRRWGRVKEWRPPRSSGPSEASDPVAGPAPDRAREGWWLDPADSNLIRYQDGQRWNHVGRSSSPRPGLPAHQAFFPLGAGPEGIPTGSPLAPGSGRYLSKYAVWGLGCLIIVGMLVGAYGIGAYQAGALSLAAAAPMIVVVGCCSSAPWSSPSSRPGEPGSALRGLRPTPASSRSRSA